MMIYIAITAFIVGAVLGYLVDLLRATRKNAQNALETERYRMELTSLQQRNEALNRDLQEQLRLKRNRNSAVTR